MDAFWIQWFLHLFCSDVVFSCVGGCWRLIPDVAYPSWWAIVEDELLLGAIPCGFRGVAYLTEVGNFFTVVAYAFLAGHISRCSNENSAPHLRHGLLCPTLFCFWGHFCCCCACGRRKRRCCWFCWLAFTKAIWLSSWRPAIARWFPCPILLAPLQISYKSHQTARNNFWNRKNLEFVKTRKWSKLKIFISWVRIFVQISPFKGSKKWSNPRL